jgi:BASS family bile acid:Na+ symporter
MTKVLNAISHFVHHYFLWLLLATYGVAAVAPGLGQAIRNVSLGEVHVLGEKMRVTLPVVMLAFLIFNAGLGIQPGQVRNLIRRPSGLILGLAANLFVPIAYIFAVSVTMRWWHSDDEVQNILTGLALVASMPIAGSSTAWSQNANGNLALSLGLVLFSTLLSWFTTPVALHAVGWVTKGDYSEDLHTLAQGSAGSFLAISVILPSLIGIGVRRAAGGERIQRVRPVLKLLNSIDLLLLNYSNAALSLPKAIAERDWDFLAAILIIVVGLCATAFAAGYLIARWTGADHGQKVSLMFGLGMNNNGTGLVVASIFLGDHPLVLLPIIFYNLVQHLVAGTVDYLLKWGMEKELNGQT